MRLRPTSLIAAAAVAATASTLAAQAQARPLAHPAAVKAKPSPWLQLSSGFGVDSSTQPRVVRWHGRLLVVWIQQTVDLQHSGLKTRLLGSTGKVAGPVKTALTWSELSSDPAPFLLHGTPTIAFGGLRTLNTSDPYTGPMAYVQAADASSWTLGHGSMTASRSAYGDYGFGAGDDGHGHALTAGVYSSSDHVTVHYGIDPSVPAAVPDTQLAGTGGDAQNANLARDPKTGISYALWYSSSSNGAQQGIRAARIYPTAGAPMPPAPLSTVNFGGVKESVNSLQDVGVTGRVGGGVWAAYSSGYPSPHKLVLWHVGTRQTLTLTTSGEVQYPSVAAGPGGRLWAFWIEGSTVHAVRTNPAVTKWGVVRVLNTPHGPGESPTHDAGDGSLGPLDLIVNVAHKPLVKNANAAPEIFSTRILESLRVAVSPAKVSYATGGHVTVTVTDAGVPVAGAAVKIGSGRQAHQQQGKGRVRRGQALGQGLARRHRGEGRLRRREVRVQGRLATPSAAGGTRSPRPPKPLPRCRRAPRGSRLGPVPAGQWVRSR